jgi:hypothetical protein
VIGNAVLGHVGLPGQAEQSCLGRPKVRFLRLYAIMLLGNLHMPPQRRIYTAHLSDSDTNTVPTATNYSFECSPPPIFSCRSVLEIAVPPPPIGYSVRHRRFSLATRPATGRWCLVRGGRVAKAGSPLRTEARTVARTLTGTSNTTLDIQQQVFRLVGRGRRRRPERRVSLTRYPSGLGRLR